MVQFGIIFRDDTVILQLEFPGQNLEPFEVGNVRMDFHLKRLPLIQDKVNLHSGFALVITKLSQNPQVLKNAVFKKVPGVDPREMIGEPGIADIDFGGFSDLCIPSPAEGFERFDEIGSLQERDVFVQSGPGDTEFS